MTNWPLPTGGIQDVTNRDDSLTGGVQLTAGPADTKGAWVQIVTSLAHDIEGFYLYTGSKDTNTSMFVDIAVGSSGVEQPIVSNEYVGLSNAQNRVCHGNVYFNIAIPQGSRMAARNQSSRASTVIRTLAVGGKGNVITSPGHQVCETFAASTADTTGTVVDPGGTKHTFGAWQELVASTSHRGSWVSFDLGLNQNNATGSSRWFAQVAIGSAGAEQIVVPGAMFLDESAGDILTPSYLGPYAITIPEGSRVSMRAMIGVTTSSVDRVFDVVGHLFA